jgi:hypothetical protein
VPAVPQAPEPPERPRDDEAPVLPQRSSDEDDGWGDREERVDRDEWYRRERPPHHE